MSSDLSRLQLSLQRGFDILGCMLDLLSIREPDYKIDTVFVCEYAVSLVPATFWLVLE